MPGQTGVFSYTTEERERVVVAAPGAGWAHTWKGDMIIDLDGIASPTAGNPASDQEVVRFDPLTPFYTGFYVEGLDWFDNDFSLSWTAGDDLHVEDPTTHPGAIRDGTHDDLLDPIVLDLDGSLDGTPGNEPVHVDMETGTVDPSGLLSPWVPQTDPQIMFFDSIIPNGNWDGGEDIVLDVNSNGIYDRTQYYMFYGENSVPGDPYLEITKKLVDAWEEPVGEPNGIIDLGEKWYFTMLITVTNTGPLTVTDVMVKDNLGGDLGLGDYGVTIGTVKTWETGKTKKVHMEWEIGDMAPGAIETLKFIVYTDKNTGKNKNFPDGHQEYTSEGEHCLNSGATVKGFVMPDDVEFEVDYSTDPICVVVGEAPPIED
jgi:hypothetical protein